MPYTAQFFAEKLNVPVEYFNPLRNVQLDPSINLEELARVAHSLGEVIGLGLRNLAHCPVELNLMPESTLRWQSFNQKKPYFIATVFSLVAVVAAMALLFDKLAGVKDDELAKVKEHVEPEKAKEVSFKKAYGDLKKTKEEVDQIVGWMGDRFYWTDVLSELRRVLMRVEQTTKSKLRTDAGVWIEQLTTAAPRPEGEGTPGQEAGPGTGMPGMDSAAALRFRQRYGLEGRGGTPAPPPPPPADGAAPEGGAGGSRKPKGDTNEIATLTLTFRAVSLKDISATPEADKDIAYAVVQGLQNSPMFEPDPQETHTTSDVINDEQTKTFTFSVVARLKRPLKL
jgi:hypothetical protein